MVRFEKWNFIAVDRLCGYKSTQVNLDCYPNRENQYTLGYAMTFTCDGLSRFKG